MQRSAERAAIEQTAADRIVDEVISLMQDSGGEQYFGEAVTKLEHAEQCAWHAQQAGADEELILASLLHDVGHLIDTELTIRDARVGVVNHDNVGRQWLLERGFSERLAALVGGHVDAKRYLTATNAAYVERLTSASRETLRLQGGPMDEATAEAFARNPELRDMLRLRLWDEMAKDSGWRGPSLASYREMLVRHLSRLAK
jgi:phosphonate degradation associated HDIG domain protein